MTRKQSFPMMSAAAMAALLLVADAHSYKRRAIRGLADDGDAGIAYNDKAAMVVEEEASGTRKRHTSTKRRTLQLEEDELFSLSETRVNPPSPTSPYGPFGPYDPSRPSFPSGKAPSTSPPSASKKSCKGAKGGKAAVTADVLDGGKGGKGPTEPPEVTCPPSIAPSESPSATPMPSPSPSAYPSGNPTASPTPRPTPYPSSEPTASPSGPPTPKPSPSPTESPTGEPSVAPTGYPSPSPSAAPTGTPTTGPTVSPKPTGTPSSSPTGGPTGAPSVSPTSTPSVVPTNFPTRTPSVAPSGTPSGSPSDAPTRTPSIVPSASPTASPSVAPTNSAAPSSVVFDTTPVGPDGSPLPTNPPTPVPTTGPTPEPTPLPTIVSGLPGGGTPSPAGSPVTPSPAGSSVTPSPAGSPVTPSPAGSSVTPSPAGSPVTPSPAGSPVTSSPAGSGSTPLPTTVSGLPGTPTTPSPDGSSVTPNPAGSPTTPSPAGTPTDGTPSSDTSASPVTQSPDAAASPPPTLSTDVGPETLPPGGGLFSECQSGGPQDETGAVEVELLFQYAMILKPDGDSALATAAVEPLMHKQLALEFLTCDFDSRLRRRGLQTEDFNLINLNSLPVDEVSTEACSGEVAADVAEGSECRVVDAGFRTKIFILSTDTAVLTAFGDFLNELMDSGRLNEADDSIEKLEFLGFPGGSVLLTPTPDGDPEDDRSGVSGANAEVNITSINTGSIIGGTVAVVVASVAALLLFLLVFKKRQKTQDYLKQLDDESLYSIDGDTKAAESDKSPRGVVIPGGDDDDDDGSADMSAVNAYTEGSETWSHDVKSCQSSTCQICQEHKLQMPTFVPTETMAEQTQRDLGPTRTPSDDRSYKHDDTIDL